MLAGELRQKYIGFFVERGHARMPSAPLVPVDVLGHEDASVLFTGSGMEQFKPYFTGAVAPPSRRLVTIQKCLRTVDIDSVGDYSHCTLFEMLGNFSFGDYFKAEVIPWTWEFLTGVLRMDPDRLCVTVFLDDDEAFDLWNRVVGLPPERIHRQGEDKNYWPANAISEGPDGPCGPCTEIFYRTAPQEEMTRDANLTAAERFLLDDAAGRWVEIWNNVFTQYMRADGPDGTPVLTPLPQKNNDTGAGFDRLVMIVQGKRSVFETDLFAPILQRIEELSGQAYQGSMSPADFALRLAAEHARAVVLCIADGILPDNEGRGYVLRYIMRRAIRYGKTALGFDRPFLFRVAPTVIAQMSAFYPELEERRDLILTTIEAEEKRFHRTLDQGMLRLEEMLAAVDVRATGRLRGTDAFVLHDTFGFPLGLTKDIAAERNVTVDTVGFEREMEEQRLRSRAGSKMGDTIFAPGVRRRHAARPGAGKLQPTEFLGYEVLACEARITGILEGEEAVPIARAGDAAQIALDRTPFYAEAGGQVGDAGVLSAPAGDTSCALRIEVSDTRRRDGVYWHACRILEGEASAGQPVTAQVDATRRMDIMRNHTATHLLQASLRRALGGHVHQKGSLVAPDRLRFDFTHPQPMTTGDVRRVEDEVNARVLNDIPVVVHLDVPVAEAKARGAMALFGEKYGDRVRVIEVPGVSQELCGGTHLDRTSQVGLFRITSESGVASGVRRIEAVTGAGAYEYVQRRDDALEAAAALLKSDPGKITEAVERVLAQRQVLERQNRQLRAQAGEGASLPAPAEVEGIPVVAHALSEADGDALADFADRVARQHGSGVIVLAAASDGKVSFVAKVTSDLVARGFHAGNLVREVARIAGGGGGGRPDFAQAGGRDPEKLQEALAAVAGIVERQAKQRE